MGVRRREAQVGRRMSYRCPLVGKEAAVQGERSCHPQDTSAMDSHCTLYAGRPLDLVKGPRDAHERLAELPMHVECLHEVAPDRAREACCNPRQLAAMLRRQGPAASVQLRKFEGATTRI